jgi:hypothetical protein
MLAFGAAMVAMMVFRPQGLLPAKRRLHDVRGLTGLFPRAPGRCDEPEGGGR